jgi:hypothetical protein
MAKVLKCDGCGREMEPQENIAGAEKLETITRRLGKVDIKVCVSASVVTDVHGGEVCLTCVKRIVKEYKQDVVMEACAFPAINAAGVR